MRQCFQSALVGMAEHLGPNLGEHVLSLLAGTPGTDPADRLLACLYHHTTPQPHLLDRAIALCCQRRFTLERFYELVAATDPAAAQILQELLDESVSPPIAQTHLPESLTLWYPFLLGLDAPTAWWRYPDTLTAAAITGSYCWQILPCTPQSRELGILWGDRLFRAWAGLLAPPKSSPSITVRSPLTSWHDPPT
ncbi:MAG: hypothetical protein HC919_14840 [Oscillatoriales cyanobacterium SM2_2_1]|nr:hypothetical protein [Oscillatoriales cyanobacterium SM2_2_1]